MYTCAGEIGTERERKRMVGRGNCRKDGNVRENERKSERGRKRECMRESVRGKGGEREARRRTRGWARER